MCAASRFTVSFRWVLPKNSLSRALESTEEEVCLCPAAIGYIYICFFLSLHSGLGSGRGGGSRRRGRGGGGGKRRKTRGKNGVEEEEG